MLEDTELINSVISYMSRISPSATVYDVIKHFETLGVPPEKILYILHELDN